MSSETIKQRIDREVKEKLASMPRGAQLYLNLKPMKACHWCDGVMHETPTAGRLECRTCGSQSLVGRQVSVKHA